MILCNHNYVYCVRIFAFFFFISLCCCYHNHSALSTLSVKAWCSFPSICLRRWRAFPPYLVWALCLKMPVGLNCSKALSYELPALSLIYWICCPIYFLSKIKSKKNAGFHHPKKGMRRFNRIQETLVLINDSHLIV